MVAGELLDEFMLKRFENLDLGVTLDGEQRQIV